MSLQYRMIVEDDRESLLSSASEAVAEWLKRRPDHPELPDAGQRIAGDGYEISSEDVRDEQMAVRRHVVSEDHASGRWTTSLTAIATSDGCGWLWVDLEWVCDDPWDAAPEVAVPGLVRILLSEGTARVGSTPLPAQPIVISSAAVDGLIEVLRDPQRSVPVVVLSRDHLATPETNYGRARALTRELRGVAPVYVLEGSATSELNARLGPNLHVVGGAVRTFLPGLSGDEPMLRRHRVLGGSRLRDDPAGAARLVAGPLRRQSLATRPPAAYREHGQLLLRQLGSPVDQDALLEDLVAAEQAAEEARSAEAALLEALEWQALIEIDTERSLERAQARVRWLESLLTDQGRHVLGEPTPDRGDLRDLEIAGFEDILSATTLLEHVVVGDVARGAIALDQYPQAESWARKAWRALVALDEYAKARAQGWNGDFRAWCVDPPSASAPVVPASWVALRESDSVDENPKYREARTFPVPSDVAPQASVYMAAHIKLVEGGRPAPRLHFYDDCAGRTGKIHVGHIGPHLPNDQTN